MRLIDADALKTRLGQIFEEASKIQGLDLVQHNLAMETARILKNVLYTEIDKEPTAMQSWVTCEERLPQPEPWKPNF